MNNECIFCQIVKGNIKTAKIWENQNFLAILDVNPNTKGMTLVMPKKHYDSYAFDLNDNLYSRLLLAAKKVAKILEKTLKVKRVAMVMEGVGINHTHIKLYPLYGIDKKFKEIWAKKRKYFKNYQGYISTQLGPPASPSVLEKLAKKIKSKTNS